MSDDTENPRAARVLAVTCLATFMAFLDVTIVNVAFPDIRASFPGSSLAGLSWVINAYTVVFAALLIPWGRLADVAGRRRVFLVGLGLFTGASAACAAAPSAELLVAARLVQGAGAAALIPTGLALLLPEFPGSSWARAIGAWGAAGSVAAAAGPALGGVLVDAVDWRLVFLVNVPVGVAGLVLAARVLREHELTEGRRLPDLLGTGLLAGGVALVVIAVTRGEDWGWGSGTTLATLGAGVALAAWALDRSRAHPLPAIETGLWRIRSFAWINVASFLFGIVLFAFLLNGVVFLTAVWDYSVLEAGLAVTPGALVAAVVAPVAGAVAGGRGHRAVVIPGSLLLAADIAWLVLALGPEPDFVSLWLPTGAISGVAFGAVAVGLSSAAAQSLPPRQLGAGIALNMTARQLGGAFGVAGVVALVSASPGIHGFESAWVMGAIASVATAAAALCFREAPDAAPRAEAAGPAAA